MRTTVLKWGTGGLAAMLGATACSGTSLHSVGDLNGGAGSGAGESNSGGVGSSAGTSYMDPIIGGAYATAGSGAVGPGGSAGSHSGGSGQVIDPPAAGAAGDSDIDVLDCPTCNLVAGNQDVRGVAANDQKVFWVDYGTGDALGNYDGRLLARDLSGGAASVLAESLAGPESVSLSNQFAYMFVDQRTEPEHPLGVIRVPLAGGAAQPLQGLTQAMSWSTYRVFASGAGYEYWNWDGAVYRVAETPGATVETFLAARGVLRIAIAGALLYFQDPAGIWSVPLTGGTPTSVFGVGQSALEMQLVTSDDVYAMEEASKFFLTRMPKGGGTWTRIANLGNFNWSQLALDDAAHYFVDAPTANQRRILQGSLTTPGAETTLASVRIVPGQLSWWKAWTLSNVGIFLADSSGLYLTPTAP